ncbi:MAG: protein kinase domain-containing protein [Gemmatimonadaceae bacterium]
MSENPSELRARLEQTFGTAYRFDRELGGGGMARVFLAEDTALGRRVVVKVLAPEQIEGLSADRFAREVQLAARLQHPNILPVFTAGAADGIPYYTMPFVEGESLRARLERSDRIPLTDVVGILRDIARALAHAHEQGVVHRDVKPENVLLSRDAAVVADFGIAKAVNAARTETAASPLTSAGTAVGTPAYMAPEQAAGDSVDARTDLYAWGVIAYEMIAGRHPFSPRHTAQALIVAHLVEVPAPVETLRPDVPAALAALVTRCLSKVPAERPYTAREVAEQLGDLGPAGSVTTVTAGLTTPSIAVLPFVNLSTDTENEYFSDGMSEEVLSVLAQDPDLRVAARSSSFAFKGRQVDLKAIGEQLHVTTLLEGSVRRSGSRVRITVQLVDAASGYHLWSERFDRELTDIFAVQDEIAVAIARTLRERLHASARGGAAEGGASLRRIRQPVRVEAYDEYLKGRFANNRRGVGHDEAPEHFERALSLEPGFAAAHAGLGESYLWLGIFFAMPPTEAFARVRRHAARALGLDPELPDAHWLLAEVALWHDWDLETAERYVSHTLALEPHHAGAMMTNALCHGVRCQRQEALAAAAAVVRVDPLGLGTRIWYLAIAYNAGAQDLVIAEAARLIAEQPSYSEAYRWRAMAEIVTGDLQQARLDLERAGELTVPNVWWHVNIALMSAAEDKPDDVRRVRDELLRRSETEWIPPIALGQVEQALGDYDAALTWYERAFQMRDFLMTVLHTDPAFRFRPPWETKSISDDPRWTMIVNRVGLAPDATSGVPVLIPP